MNSVQPSFRLIYGLENTAAEMVSSGPLSIAVRLGLFQ